MIHKKWVMKKHLSVTRCSPPQDPVLMVIKTTYVEKRGNHKKKGITFATSSRRRFGEASTFNGVMVAEATALATLKKKFKTLTILTVMKNTQI